MTLVRDDESLGRWAERRERRKRPVGERRAMLLLPGPPRGAHVVRSGPRVLLEWDGLAWAPVGVGMNYAAERAFLEPQSLPSSTHPAGK